MEFTMDISQFTSLPNVRNEITVEHHHGVPYNICNMLPATFTAINDPQGLTLAIAAAARNNHESYTEPPADEPFDIFKEIAKSFAPRKTA